MVSMVLASLAGVARADGAWGSSNRTDGNLVLRAVGVFGLLIFALFVLVKVVNKFQAVRVAKDRLPVVATARVHGELPPQT